MKTKEYDFVLTFTDNNQLSWTDPVKSGTTDDFGNTINFIGTAYVVRIDQDSRGICTYYIKHELPMWLVAEQEYQETMIRVGYKSRSKKKIDAEKDRIEREYNLTAEDVWNSLSSSPNKVYTTPADFTEYSWGGFGVAESCPHGCCYDEYDDKKEFAKSHSGYKFKLKEEGTQKHKNI